MNKISVDRFYTPECTRFIKENIPALQDFKTHTGRKPASEEYLLEVPRQLNSPEEDELLQRAFTYLFHLNVARETRISFDVEDLQAIEGNRLVKKEHPFSFVYDYQFVHAKTRISRYIHSEPFTVPYNQMAARIYGACFLFAQLDRVAETGEVPNKLDTTFYFLPKGSFTEEFEQLNELAITEFMPGLTTKDAVQFKPTFDGVASSALSTTMILNDTLILIDTSETLADKTNERVEILRLFFFHQIKERFGSAPPLHPFTKIGFYRARFGEMETLDLGAYFGETLNERVEAAYACL